MDATDTTSSASQNTRGISGSSSGSLAISTETGRSSSRRLTDADLLNKKAKKAITTLRRDWTEHIAAVASQETDDNDGSSSHAATATPEGTKRDTQSEEITDDQAGSEANTLRRLTNRELLDRTASNAVERLTAALKIEALDRMSKNLERARGTTAEVDMIAPETTALLIEETLEATRHNLHLLDYQNLELATERLRRDVHALTPYGTLNGEGDPAQTGHGLPQFTERFRQEAETVLEKCNSVFDAVVQQADKDTLLSARLEACAALGACLSVVRTKPLIQPADFQNYSWDVTRQTDLVRTLANDETQASIWRSKALEISKLSKRLISTVCCIYNETMKPDAINGGQGDPMPSDAAEESILGPCREPVDWTVFGLAKLKLTGLVTHSPD